MASKVDLSLDDIIVKNKISTRGSRRGRGRGGGRRGMTQSRGRGIGGLRGRGRGIRSPSSFRSPRGSSNINGRWSHDMYYGGASAIRSVPSGPTKLNITNLDYGVSDSDIKELFSEFGAMKNASVHYDRAGRSLGTAHVIFDRRGDALKAIKQYNGVHLDGRPMNIEIDGPSGGGMIGSRVSSMVRGRGSSLNGVGAGRNVRRLQGGPRPIGGRGRGAPRGRGGARGAGRGRGGRMGRGGGGRGARRKVPTAEELDAELDAYTFQANK